MYGSWDMVRNRRTDGQKKWNIEVGTPPRKIKISNWVQLFLEWKKKRTVNKILSPKLWYIGQIYTIPKFIKEEIEKIYQLSIWKCGLGILDIDTQLELQFCRTSMNLKIIRPYQSCLERSHAVLIELKE